MSQIQTAVGGGENPFGFSERGGMRMQPPPGQPPQLQARGGGGGGGGPGQATPAQMQNMHIQHQQQQQQLMRQRALSQQTHPFPPQQQQNVGGNYPPNHPGNVAVRRTPSQQQLPGSNNQQLMSMSQSNGMPGQLRAIRAQQQQQQQQQGYPIPQDRIPNSNSFGGQPSTSPHPRTPDSHNPLYRQYQNSGGFPGGPGPSNPFPGFPGPQNNAGFNPPPSATFPPSSSNNNNNNNNNSGGNPFPPSFAGSPSHQHVDLANNVSQRFTGGGQPPPFGEEGLGVAGYMAQQPSVPTRPSTAHRRMELEQQQQQERENMPGHPLRPPSQPQRPPSQRPLTIQGGTVPQRMVSNPGGPVTRMPLVRGDDGLPLPPQQQQQQPQPHRFQPSPVGSGQGLTRLLQFSGVLSQEVPNAEEETVPHKLQLHFWKMLMNEYFTGNATMKFTLWKDSLRQEAKPFEIGRPILPRFFLVTTQSGVKSMSLSLDGARERLAPVQPGFGSGINPPPFGGSNHSVVECACAIWTYRYNNGYTITLRGPLTVHIVAVANPPNLNPSQPPPPPHQPLNAFGGVGYTLKFDNFQFDANKHDAYVLVDNMNPQSLIIGPSPTLSPTPPGGGGGAGNAMQADQDRKYDGRLIITNASLPEKPVNAFGIPQATMRCLELAESVSHMTELMTFSLSKTLGPVESLHQFALELRENNPGLKPSGRIASGGSTSFSNFATPANSLYAGQQQAQQLQQQQTQQGGQSQPLPPRSSSPTPPVTSSVITSPKIIPPATPGSPKKSATGTTTTSSHNKTPVQIPPPPPPSAPAAVPVSPVTTPATTPALASASLKRKGGSGGGGDADTQQQPPAKRATRKRRATGGGGG